MTPESAAVLRLIHICGGHVGTAEATWSAEVKDCAALRMLVTRLVRRGFLRHRSHGVYSITSAGLVALDHDDRGLGSGLYRDPMHTTLGVKP